MKKIILFLVCGICLIGCVNVSKVTKQPIKNLKESGLLDIGEELVIPKQSSLFLDSVVEKDERVPVLDLSAIAGGGCDFVSDLYIKERYDQGKLVIDIVGYEFREGWEEEICPAVVLESKAEVKVDIDWLKEAKEREVVFNLNGQENKYKVDYNQYKVTLSGIQASNVISHSPTINLPAKPADLEVVLYPTDVGALYLAGSLTNKDYRSKLSEFAESNGFIPAEKVYEGLEQIELRQLYVVVRDRDLPEPNHGEALGSLSGEVGADVYLKSL